ncbi:MAG: TonB-dependent receptor, partial [Sphingomonadaceae bacterium]
QQFRTLAVPVERYLFAASGSYEVSDNISVFFEGTYNKTTSSRIIEPFPLESGGANGIFPTDGGFNVENFVTRDFGNGVETRIIANPYVPGRILAASEDTNGDGLRDIGFVRRLVEFGPRSGRTDRDFYRFVVGLQGDIADNRFRWDVSYNYGQVNENQSSSGQVNVVNFRDALAGIPDFDDVNGNGLTTDVICADPEARANGCVAANIFGAGALSQGAVDYIAAQGTYQTGIKQHVVQGNISGSLAELPAGPLGVAVGVEYRKESSFEDNDALTNAGLNAGNKLPDTSGSFDVKEAFAEVRIPILADKPGFELLEVGGAFRYADYSTVGSIESYSARGSWQIIPDIKLRGTWSRAVRAPNVSELFSGLSQTFPSGLQDPCAGVGPTGGGTLGDTCRADPGVAANIAANGVFTLNQADIQGISGFNGGNPNLGAETADSWTVGAVINPRSVDALRDLVLTVDYYNIKIKDVISSFPRQFTIDQCFGQGNNTFCDLIVRRATATAVNSAGSIDLVNALQVNAAIQETDGIDATLSWKTDLGLISPNDRMSFRVAYTHVFANDYTPLAGEPVDPAAGEIGTAKDRFTANLAYLADDMKMSFTGTWIGRSYEDDQFCGSSGPKCAGVPAQFYLDMQTSFYASDALEVYFGADNLLDNKAPLIPTGTTFNVTGADTAADVYDIFGRRFYAGVRMRF